MSEKAYLATISISPDDYPAWVLVRQDGEVGEMPSPNLSGGRRGPVDSLVVFADKGTLKGFMRDDGKRMREFKPMHLSWEGFVRQCRQAYLDRGLDYLMIYFGGNRRCGTVGIALAPLHDVIGLAENRRAA